MSSSQNRIRRKIVQRDMRNPKNVRPSKTKIHPTRHVLFFKLFLTFCLLMGCSILTYTQLMKFINTHTTIATRVDKSHDKLNLPSIGFCPGLKSDKVKELVWPIRIYDTDLRHTNDTFEDTFNNTREGMREIWDDYTYSADEFVDAINAEFQNLDLVANEYTEYEAKDLLNGREGCLMLEEHWTPLGKCFSLHTLCPVMPNLSVSLKFNLTLFNMNKLTVSLRHVKATIGTIGYEPGLPVHLENLEGGGWTDIELFTKKKVNAKGANLVEEEDFYACVHKAVFDKARQLSYKLCYHPSFEFILGPELSRELEPCQTEPDFYMANPTLMEAMMLPNRDHGCQEPKTFTTYDYRQLKFMKGVTLDDNIATIFVYLGNADIIIEEDYDLQDFYAIIATIGGYTGIFFGWSFYDLVKFLPSMVNKKMRN